MSLADHDTTSCPRGCPGVDGLGARHHVRIVQRLATLSSETGP